MAALNFTSTTLSGFLEADFDQLKDLLQDGGVTAVVFDTTSLSIGGVAVTSTATEINLLDGVTATTAELNYVDGVTSNIQDQLNAKGTGTVDTSGSPIDNDFAKFTDANTIEGRSYAEVKTDLSLNNVENTALSTWSGTANITTVDVTAVTAHESALSIGAIQIADGSVTDTEFQYINTLSSNAQDQIDSLGNPEGTDVLSTGETGAVKFLREDGDGTCSWQTPAGAGDVSAVNNPVDNDFAKWTSATTIEGRSYAEVRTDLGLVIGTDVLAEQTIGIADDNLVEIDDAGVQVNDYAKFTANGLTGRTFAQVKIDLGYMTDLVDDTTPTLGGELDAGAHTIGFTAQTATGDGTTTIDWKLGNKMHFTHGEMDETFTFTAPTNECNLLMTIKQDGTAGGRDCTWPATVKWLGDEPTWSDGGVSKTMIVSFYYDGTSYWGQGSPWET